MEVAGEFGIGGSEQAIQVRAEQLSRTFFDVMVVAFNAGGPRLQAIEAGGVPSAVCHGDWAEFERVLHSYAPHIVHYSRGASRGAYVKKIHQVARAANVSALIETNMFGRVPRDGPATSPSVVCHMSLASMLRFSRLSAVPMNQLWEMGHRAVYLPVPASKWGSFQISPNARLSIRAQMGVTEGEILACRVGRPDIRKWSARLEMALPAMFHRTPNLRLLFMAAPDEKLHSLSRRYGNRIILRPPSADVSDLTQMYQASDIMVHSSGIGESFGLSLAEGMYWGLPVVVDSTPGLDNAQIELVDHGSTGIVVDSASGFAEAVSQLAAEPERRRAMGEAGRSKAKDRYVDARIIPQWEKIYINALSQARPAIVPAATVEYANAVEALPEDCEYQSFPPLYRQRVAMLLGSHPSALERIRHALRRSQDTRHYIRKVGLSVAFRVAASRLRSGLLLRRN